MPRALWTKAPFVLAHHRASFFAVLCTALLVAMGAAAAPLMNAAAESEALQNELAALSPLGAGLTIQRPAAPGGVSADRARRAAAVQLGRTLPSTSSPVLTTSSYALLSRTGYTMVVTMARTGATAHVTRLDGDGNGAWISQAIAKPGHLRPGQRLGLSSAGPGLTRTTVRIGAVYRQLDADLANTYWVDFISRIRSENPDAPLPPTFVLVGQKELYRLSRTVGGGLLANVYEFPVDTHAMTPRRAEEIARAFADVRSAIANHAPLAARLGCGVGEQPCSVSSSLLAAVGLAKTSNAALLPIVSLLAGFCVVLALAAAAVAGAFISRRRAAEARLSLVGGEPWLAFAARSALEAAVPTAVGAAAGLLIATELVRLFTPAGAVDRSVFVHAALLALGSIAAVVAVVAVGATAARGRLADRRYGLAALPLPWELLAAAAAAAAWIAVLSGRGLVRDAAAGAHPRLVVLLLPSLVAAAVAGGAARVVRAVVRRSDPVTLPSAAFLGLRRVAAARGFVVVLTVTIAVGVAALVFAEVLQTSLDANSVEKAYVANGSDVQGLIDPLAVVPASFPYPVTKVTESFDAAHLASGAPAELLVSDPKSLLRVLDAHWPSSVVSALEALAHSRAAWPAIAVGVAPGAQPVSIGSAHVAVHVVATVRAFPGMVEGEPLLVVRARDVAAAPAAREALDAAFTYLWATGPPLKVERALAGTGLKPTAVTTVATFANSPGFTTITNTYGFLRIVASACALIALIALMLYLQARARSQLVTSEFLRRMGMPTSAQARAVALEAAVLVSLATLVGAIAALATAWSIVGRVDPIPQYAPSATTVVPWTLLIVSGLVTIAVAGGVGVLAASAVRTRDVGKALRVS